MKPAFLTASSSHVKRTHKQIPHSDVAAHQPKRGTWAFSHSTPFKELLFPVDVTATTGRTSATALSGTSPASCTSKDSWAGLQYLNTTENPGSSVYPFHLPLLHWGLTGSSFPRAESWKGVFRELTGCPPKQSSAQSVLCSCLLPLRLAYHCYASISCCPTAFKSRTADQDINSYRSLSLIVH